jgi:putative Mn2+ efflux pump MntP
MTFGDVNIWLWAVLFVLTLVYEAMTVKVVLAIEKLQSTLVANLSVMLGAIGMGCVAVYSDEVNNIIPILLATWVGNYYIVEFEKKKRAKEKKTTFDKTS